MPLDLSSIPIVDNHCHSLLREQPADDDAFRIHLTETYFPEVARDDVPHTLLYHWTIRELAGLLDCSPTPDAVHAARRERGRDWIAREAVTRGNFKTWLIDTGYGPETTLSLDELRDGRPVPDRGDPPAGADDRAADPRARHVRRRSSTRTGRGSTTCGDRGWSGSSP